MSLRSITIAVLFLPAVAAAQGAADDGQLVAAAARIDTLVARQQQQRGVEPLAAAADGTFARRAWLQLAGRIPTRAELAAFTDDRAPDRRDRLIATLLASPGQQSHLFHFWSDLLRLKSRLMGRISGEPYIHFVKRALADNMAYDRFVQTLLTAEGPAHARGNGATGYYLRDRGMPEDNMANTVRVFLGTRLECAQCHNHPFDKWTQRDFHRMVAFTGGLRYTADDIGGGKDRQWLRRTGQEIRRAKGQQAFRAFRQLLRGATSGVAGTGTGVQRLPKDYQYDDARPRQAVTARTMFGARLGLEVELPKGRQRGRGRPPRLPEIDSRRAYARWLTAAENPRFALVIANRMWKHLFGRGLIEPVDDLRDDTVADHPELMAYLEELMVALDFDLRRFQQVLCMTDTWQRVADPQLVAAGTAWTVRGPLVQRMSAEQMWDSLLTLVVPDLDGTLQDPGARAERTYAEFEEFAAMDRQGLLARVERETLRYTDPVRYRQMRADERRARHRRGRGRRGQRGLVRASDLPSPAPAGHLVRQFGQSDREQIEAGHRAANVPQVLSLINGFVDQRIARSGAVLWDGLQREQNARARLAASYLAILGRKPTAWERDLWLTDLQSGGARPLTDLVWTLVNTHEFRCIR